MTFSDFAITIYHNPSCGTSRNVLAIIKAAGYEPEVVHYLDVGWSRELLSSLLAAAGLSAREALRETKSPAMELGLLESGVTAERLLKFMVEHPLLVNRPFVQTPKGTRLCRPSELVLDLLERLPLGPLYKEDGSLILDASGKRLS